MVPLSVMNGISLQEFYVSCKIFVIQQIVTMPIYDQEALAIYHSYKTDALRIDRYPVLNLAEYRPEFSQLGLRPRRLSIRRYSARLSGIIFNYAGYLPCTNDR